LDIFALQDEITLSVVGPIEPTLRDAELFSVEATPGIGTYSRELRGLPYAGSPAGDSAGGNLPPVEEPSTASGADVTQVVRQQPPAKSGRPYREDLT